MHYTYTVKSGITGATLETYQAPASAKYSQALARLKKYKKYIPVIIETETLDIITRSQCEYILK